MRKLFVAYVVVVTGGMLAVLLTGAELDNGKSDPDPRTAPVDLVGPFVGGSSSSSSGYSGGHHSWSTGGGSSSFGK